MVALGFLSILLLKARLRSTVSAFPIVGYGG
jgi:hypothetical protein